LYFESVNDFPEDVGRGGADGFALEDNRLHSHHQWSVDDEGVAEHPSDIAGAEHAVSWMSVVYFAHGVVQQYGCASVVADDAFGFAGGATGVEDVEGVAGVEDDWARAVA
jgi:hypothetical protein